MFYTVCSFLLIIHSLSTCSYANFVFNVQKFFDIENVIAPEMNQSYYAWNEWQLIKAEVLRRRDPKANVDEDDLWGKVKNAFTA